MENHSIGLRLMLSALLITAVLGTGAYFKGKHDAKLLAETSETEPYLVPRVRQTFEDTAEIHRQRRSRYSTMKTAIRAKQHRYMRAYGTDRDRYVAEKWQRRGDRRERGQEI